MSKNRRTRRQSGTAFLWTKLASKDLASIQARKSDSLEHARVCGATGSGKTSNIFVPNLIAHFKSTAIVPEATAGNELPDLYRQTAHFRSNIQLTWRVDSPVNRSKANELQRFTKGAREEAVGLHWYDKPKGKSPFMPPAWLMIALLMSVVYAGQADSVYQAKKVQSQNQWVPNR